ncbi:MAG: hypothetical protein K2W96_18650, partial [Gemmataceae bacterium]|nr:hypothetical protein [Gemmataceae bacterium]
SEVHILSVDAEDADRVAVGRPLMGAFEVAAASEVRIEQADPDPETGIWPHVAANGLAMIIAGEDEP